MSDERFTEEKDRLKPSEIALIELYQRQDALSTQLWQQFLLANMATIGVVLLLTIAFTGRGLGVYVGYLAVAAIWAVFSYGNLSAVRNSQEVLRKIGHQIEGDIGHKAEVFRKMTKSPDEVRNFHRAVNFCIFVLCVFLASNSDIRSVADRVAQGEPSKPASAPK